MAEEGFADDELTLLVLRDVTLFGNSDELQAYDRALVLETQSRLLREGYAKILKGIPPGKTGARPDRGILKKDGRLLMVRLERKLKEK